MGIEIKKSVDFSKIEEPLLEETRKSIADVMKIASEQIVDRTKSGIDVNGRAFAPYSDSYAAAKVSGDARKHGNKGGKVRKAKVKRAKTGKLQKPKVKKSGATFGPKIPVDLTLWGNLLNAITYDARVTHKEVIGRIFFNSSKQGDKARDITNGVYFGKKTKKARKFFGLSTKQKQSVKAKFKRRFNNLLKKIDIQGK